MKKLFVAAFLIVMILISSSVFVHISTDLIVSETVHKHSRSFDLRERQEVSR